MKPGNFKLHIEELVLHGFAPDDRQAIAAAVERELTGLLATRFSAQGAADSLTRDGLHPRLDGGAFQVSAGARADSIGAQIARAVHGGLTK
jgi:hypothetical protein